MSKCFCDWLWIEYFCIFEYLFPPPFFLGGQIQIRNKGSNWTQIVPVSSTLGATCTLTDSRGANLPPIHSYLYPWKLLPPPPNPSTPMDQIKGAKSVQICTLRGAGVHRNASVIMPPKGANFIWLHLYRCRLHLIAPVWVQNCCFGATLTP